MKDADVRNAPRPPYKEMVAFAIRAPSVHNTQPWLWRTSETGLELFADWSRQLSHADPDGRDVLVSCGAALHHLQVAAAALGWATDVRHGPDPGYPRLLASITFTRHDASPEMARRLTCVMVRQTDRRRFASWPVPREQLESLARCGSEWGTTVTSVQDEAVRTRLLRLTADADERQRRDPAYAAELARWARDRERDGVPATNVPEADPTRTAADLIPQRYPPGTLVDDWQDRTSSPPGMLVIATSSDDVLSRVRAGEALSAVWLEATERGLVGVPLSQATEVDQTRLLLEGRELRDRACPQILFCVGWPRADRAPLPATPRRPVTQVLLRAD
jgi:nitroreductase